MAQRKPIKSKKNRLVASNDAQLDGEGGGSAGAGQIFGGGASTTTDYMGQQVVPGLGRSEKQHGKSSKPPDRYPDAIRYPKPADRYPDPDFRYPKPPDRYPNALPPGRLPQKPADRYPDPNFRYPKPADRYPDALTPGENNWRNPHQIKPPDRYPDPPKRVTPSKPRKPTKPNKKKPGSGYGGNNIQGVY